MIPTGLVIAIAIIVILAIALPTILKNLGLHADYKGSKQYNLKGKRALIITTSHDVLSKQGEDKGQKTGVFGSEMTVPYYEFQDAGMEVDVASVKGGEIPIDPQSFYYVIKSEADKRFLKDKDFQAKVKNSLKIDEVDFTKYDAIMLAGGWGAAYDLGQSEVLGKKISEAYYAETPVIGSVCHGALGLIQAKDKDGNPLIAGREITGVTNKQLRELFVTHTPLHPETELKKAGVAFKSNTKALDALATVTVVDHEKRFVTGQNQNSGHETAQKMMAIINERQQSL